MKKLTNIFLLCMMVLSVILVSGCGNEEKYNTAKNEVLQLIETAKDSKIEKPDYIKSDDKKYSTQEYYQKRLAYWDKRIEEYKNNVKIIDEKLTKMEDLAKSDTKLNNDLISLKKEIKEKEKMQINILKESKDAVKITQNPDVANSTLGVEPGPSF